MPPQQLSNPPGIKWNEVTWYSKLGAIILFSGVVPILSFYIGTQYQATQDTITIQTPSLQESSPASTQIFVLNQWFKKDVNHVYEYNGRTAGWQILPPADPATFSILERGYAKDSTLVYYKNQGGPDFEPTVVLKGADPNTFTILSSSYAKDQAHVWAIDPGFGGAHMLKGADPYAFEVTDTSKQGLTAKDTHHTYGPVGPKNFDIDVTSTF